MKKNTLKKLFCVILAVAVFAVSIPFTAIAANPSEVNFAIISDPHYFASTAMGYSDADRKGHFSDGAAAPDSGQRCGGRDSHRRFGRHILLLPASDGR